MDKLVKAIIPDFPSDRAVRVTKDVSTWYKINTTIRTLYVPPVQVLKSNVRELDRFAEAIHSFAAGELSEKAYNWTDLTTYEFTGNRVAEAVALMHQDLLRRDVSERYVSCDIETRRVEWMDNKLLAIGFGIDANTSMAFYDCDWQNQEIHEALQAMFDDTSIRFIWQNGKFDCGRLKYLVDLNARVDEDTMLLHYIGINEKQGTHGLKDMGQLYLQAPAWDEELDRIKKEWCRKNKVRLDDFMYDYFEPSVLIPYMQRDCIATYRLLFEFRKLARPESDFIYRQLIRASNVYMQVELNGVYLDLQAAEDLEFQLDNSIREASIKMDEVAATIWNPELYKRMTGAKSATDKFNVKSPKQLKWMLQEVLGYPINSTNAATFKALMYDIDRGAVQSPVAREFVESINTVRRDSKALETFVLGLRDNMCSDHRVRGTFNLHGTETGRLSSNKPNMQNIPRNKAIKNLLRAAPGHQLLQLDYSQAELRVLAMLSGDPTLIQIYKDGQDLHNAVTDNMFGPGSHKDKELRNLAKTINFGIAYGRGASSISEAFGKSRQESQEIIDKWFASMPLVKTFINNRRKMVTRGEPCVTLLGRERHFVITNEELYHIQNEYINTPIQSLASDFTMLSLMGIHDHLLAKYHGKARIVTTVHDSIILEVEDDLTLIKSVGRDCVAIMATTPLQYVPECPVPFVADAEYGYRWGDLTKLDTGGA